MKLEVKGRDDAKWKLERGVRGIYTVWGVVDSRTKMTGTSKENDQKDPFT